jgi:hypothetical protein
MLKRRNIEACLGIGSVRAKVNSESASEPQIIINEPIKNIEVEAQGNTETFSAANETKEEVLKTEAPQSDSLQLLMALLEKQVASLEKQLEVKDQQLASKDDIIKNFQVLLKSEQDNVLKLTTSAATVHIPQSAEDADFIQSEQSAWWKKWFK